MGWFSEQILDSQSGSKPELDVLANRRCNYQLDRWTEVYKVRTREAIETQ